MNGRFNLSGRDGPFTGRGLLGGALTRAKGVRPLWTPLLLGASLSAWWDASASATLTLAGSNVSAWASRVGSITATQATGANQPTWSATARNGTPGVVFAGTPQHLAFNATGLPTGNAVSTIVVAGFGNSTAIANQTFIAWGSSVNGQMRIVGYRNQATARIWSSSYGSNDWSLTELWTQDRCVILYAPATGTASFTVDGTTYTQAFFAQSTTGTNGRIGSLADGSQGYLIGTVQQILVTSTDLGTTDRQKVEGWESWGDGKAGTNLPAGHPYKSAAPRASIAECEQWADEQGWRVIDLAADRERARLIYTPPRRLIVPDRGWRIAA